MVKGLQKCLTFIGEASHAFPLKKKKKNIMYLAALDLSCGTGDLLCCRTQNLELWHADSSLQHV